MSTEKQQLEVSFNAGTALKSEQKLEEALIEFKKCLALDESNFNTYKEVYELMRCLNQDYSDSVQYLIKFLNLHPSSQEALEYVSKVASNANKIQKEILDKSISTLKDKGVIYFSLGRIIFEQLLENEKASFYFTKYLAIIKLQELSADDSHLIGKCFHQAKKDNAHILLQNALEKQKSQQIYQLLVEDYIQNEMFFKAFKCALDEKNQYPDAERPSINSLKDTIQRYIIEFYEATLKDNIPVEQLKQKGTFIRTHYSVFVSILENIFKINPKNYITCKCIGLLLFIIQVDIPKAIKYMDQCLFLNPNDYQIHFYLGLYYYQYKEDSRTFFGKAIQYFEKILDIYLRSVNKLDINIAMLYYYISKSYMNVNDYKKSIYYSKKSMILTKQFQSLCKINLSSCYFLLKNHERCFETIREYYSENTYSKELNQYLFAIFRESQDISLKNRVTSFLVNFAANHQDIFLVNLEATLVLMYNFEYELSLFFLQKTENILNNSLEKIPQQCDHFTNRQYLKFLRGQILFVLDQIDESEQQMLEIFKENQTPEIIGSLRSIYEKKGNKEKQEYYQQLLISKSKEPINYYIKIAKSQKEQKAFKMSLENFQFCKKMDPLNYSFYDDFGYVLQETGNYKEAIEVYKVFLEKVKPDDVECIYSLGCSYLQLNQIETAKEYFVKCIAKQSTFKKAIKQLVLIYKNEKNYEEAIHCLENELKENPNQLDSIIEIMDIEDQCLKSQDTEKLRKYLEKAQKINPEDPRVKKYDLMLKLQQI